MRRGPLLFFAGLLALLTAVAFLTADDSGETPGGAAGRTTGEASEETIALRLASSLRPFDGCGTLLDHAKTQAAAHGGPLGYGGRWGHRDFVGDVAAAPTASPSLEAVAARSPGDGAAPATEAQSSGTPGFSGTNVQEAGVDEPDTVKTDGRRLFTVARGRLHALDVTGGRHRLAGSLELPEGGAELLLAGDHLMVIASGWGHQPFAEDVPAGPADVALPGQERTVLRLVDVSDPARMAVTSTLEVDGRVVGARMVGDTVRLVTTASPRGFQPVFPQGPSAEDQARAEAENLRQVDQSTLTNWLPSFRLEKPDRAIGAPAVTSGLLVSCDRVSRPEEFSGLGTISVLTFDLSAADLGDGDATTILADGETVYASATNLYVATTRSDNSTDETLGRGVAEIGTDIHKFDITGAGPARHVASGRVDGRLLNQFSLSEHQGHLRVATTKDDFTGAGDSESFVTVLADRDGRLVRTGMVGDLGRGERIYAVRFLDDVGYVVTFRQIDPLYTIDLSDPARPLVVGELKIPGYSAYLHPLGDGLLLGIGQDATDTGQRLGAQMSLFDVSDPAHPERLDQAALGSGASSVEYDHHAFLWWDPRRLAVVPVQTWDRRQPSTGAIGFSVSRDGGIDEIGRLSHDGREGDNRPGTDLPESIGSPIQRSLVIGEALFTLSDTGVLASDLGGLDPLTFVRFP